MSCEDKPFYVEIIDASDPSYPAFCVSMSKSACPQGLDPPDWISHFGVEKVDVDTKNQEPLPSPEETSQLGMWEIEPASPIYTKFSLVRYGVAPAGWKTVRSARPLAPGTLYQVGHTWFACFGRRPNGACQIYSLEEYWDFLRTHTEPGQ